MTVASNELWAGQVLVRVCESEEEMGTQGADKVVEELLHGVAEDRAPVLWLMAAPSGFAFYDALVRRAVEERAVQRVLEGVPVYQFDDYPIRRGSEQFPVTFRHLLEERLVEPLKQRAGVTVDWRPLELTDNGAENGRILEAYEQVLLELLQDEQVRVVEVKGIGMDGHWGFHGAETPLDAPAGMMEVGMNPENVTQQMIDWPEYFSKREDVPRKAATCNVSMFLQAEAIVDLVPQATKAYSVLATYGTGQIVSEVPSSAIKSHPRAFSFLTKASAQALVRFREISPSGEPVELPQDLLSSLESLWESEESREQMRGVLEKLGLS